MTDSLDISQDEVAIYDRQIRLWGIDAQQRIRAAHVLLVGMRALGNEVCKNIALAGVGKITILDHETVQEQDLGAHFFLTENDIGKNRASAAAVAVHALNPRVQVIVDQERMADKPDEFFDSFDIVCFMHQDLDTLLRADALRRKVGKPFYAADAFGWFGYIFCDLSRHMYIEEKKTLPPGAKSSDEPVVTRSPKVEEYISLEESLKKDWSGMAPRALKKRISAVAFLVQVLFQFQHEYKRSPSEADIPLLFERKAVYLQQIGISDTTVLDDALVKDLGHLLDTEMAPVAAIVGGVLAQEMIKVLSTKGSPVQNWFFYNGLDGSGLIHKI